MNLRLFIAITCLLLLLTGTACERAAEAPQPKTEQQTDSPETSDTIVSITVPQLSRDTCLWLKALIDGHRHYPVLRVSDYCCSDLNADGLKDYLVIAFLLKREKGTLVHQGTRAILLINTPDDGYQIASFNDKLVNRNGVPRADDRMTDVEVTNGEMAFSETVGACQRSEFVRYFRYDAAQKDWLLTRFTQTHYSCDDPENSRTETQTPKDFGKVRFADAAGGY